MDCISQNSPTSINCLKHPKKKILFVQIKEIKENQDLLMCSNCLDDIEYFKAQNYIQIDNILDIDENDIIDKWPLLNNDSLHKQIKCLTQKNEEVDFSEEILLFFDNLKQEIIQKIEDVKKQMITASQQLPNCQNHLIEEIKKLSQTNTLKQIFTDSKQNYKQMEDRLREFIKKFESQKQNNTEIINNLIKEYQQNQQIYDLKTRDLFKSSFYNLTEKVDQFFQKLNALQNSYDLLPKIQMIQTIFGQSQQQLQIVKSLNNSISISQYSDGWTNCVSDFILDENTNYVFRFQFTNNSQSVKLIAIGLQQDYKEDQNAKDFLYFYFEINQKSLLVGGNGLDKKQQKGNIIELKCKEVEMRVCIKERVLQILDSPHNNHILSINDQYKNKMQEYENLRLNILLFSKDLNIKLIHVEKCFSFN